MVEPICRHAIEHQAIIISSHPLEFVLEGLQAEDTLTGWFDEERLIQVLNNLISNAIKYSPAGSVIKVGLRYTSERPGEALIWVKDAGIGIPAGELPHIFKRFHRVSTLDRAIRGLGIGLYLVDELVTRHGGHVYVESTEGKGSTFFVTLPLNQSSHI